MVNFKIPNYRDLTTLYLAGITQEEIIRMYGVDAPPIDVRSKKHDTKIKIIHFFRVVETSKKAYIEHPRARINRTELISYVCKKILVSTTSVMRILEALEEQGWNLQEATMNMEILDRSISEKM